MTTYEISQQESRLLHVPIKELARRSTVSVDSVLQRHLMKRTEGFCDNYGYIVPGSVRLLDRQMGKLLSVDTESLVEYRISYSFSAINPCPGDEYQVVIGSLTKAGILGFLKGYDDIESSPVLCMIPNKDVCMDGKDITSFKEGDTVSVSLLKSRIKYRGRQIQVVAKLI